MDDFNLDIAGRRRIDYRHGIEVNADIILSLPKFLQPKDSLSWVEERQMTFITE